MCSRPKTPKVVQRDPEAEAEKARQLANAEANQALAFRRSKLRKNSLLTNGAGGADGARRMMGTGRQAGQGSLLGSATPMTNSLLGGGG